MVIIRKYRTSYRFIVFCMCLFSLIVITYDFFMLRSHVAFVYSDVIISLLPDVGLLLFFLASLYDFLFTERFDLFVGGFVIVIATLKLLTDFIKVRDGVTPTAVFSVLIFVVLRIPFIHAVVYNVTFTFLFIAR